MSEHKERSEDSELRGIVYHELLSHIKKAKEAGFYLEVITLFESLICDRLESRNSFLNKNSQVVFKDLGKNLQENNQLFPIRKNCMLIIQQTSFQSSDC